MAEQSCVENDNIYKQYFEEIKDQYFKREDSVEILIMDIPEGVSYHTTQEYYYSIQYILQYRSDVQQLKQWSAHLLLIQQAPKRPGVPTGFDSADENSISVFPPCP